MLRSHLRTVGLSEPDVALVHGFRGGGGEEHLDTGDGENPETHEAKWNVILKETDNYGP